MLDFFAVYFQLVTSGKTLRLCVTVDCNFLVVDETNWELFEIYLNKGCVYATICVKNQFMFQIF